MIDRGAHLVRCVSERQDRGAGEGAEMDGCEVSFRSATWELAAYSFTHSRVGGGREGPRLRGLGAVTPHAFPPHQLTTVNVPHTLPAAETQ